MCRLLFAALLLALPAVFGLQSHANATALPTVSIDPSGSLAIGGIAIVQLRDKSVCESMDERAGRIMARMVNALEKVHKRGRFRDIRVTVVPPRPGEPPGEPWIAVEGVLVMKVTFEDARATGQSTSRLAQIYADKFRRALRRIYAS